MKSFFFARREKYDEFCDKAVIVRTTHNTIEQASARDNYLTERQLFFMLDVLVVHVRAAELNSANSCFVFFSFLSEF